MNETSQTKKGKGEITCSICGGAMKEERTMLTFYDAIDIDATLYVCEQGHTTETEGESERIAKELKEKERHLKTSYIWKIVGGSFLGAILLFLGSFATLYLIWAYGSTPLRNHAALITLVVGAAIILPYFFLAIPRLFKTFIIYWNAKHKVKEDIKEHPEEHYDPEDPLGALDEP